jgi:hypothetical protein
VPDERIQGLLRQNDWGDFSGWLVELQDFDEVPLYSGYDQVAFLSHLPYEQRNRLLLCAAAVYLGRLVEYLEDRRQRGHDDDCFCMLSVLEWEEWEESGGESLLLPAMWFTNPSKDVLSYVPLAVASGAQADAVRAWLPEGDFLVCRNTLAGDPIQRVYVIRPPMLPSSLSPDDLRDPEPGW